MTILARLSSKLSGPLSVCARRLALAAAALTTVASTLVLAAPAGAVVTKVEGQTVGVQPRISESYVEGSSASTYANPSGNPVLHGSNTFAIYWDPTDHYSYDWQNAIDGYLHNVGAASGQLSTVFAVDSQYTDKSDQPASYAQTFKGAYTDTRPYPFSGCEDPAPFELVDQIGREFGATPEPICITSTQVANEVEAFIAGHGLPKGIANIYYLLTPPGVTVCLDGGKSTGHCSDYEEGSVASYENSFCSYHADINPGGLATGDGNTIVYGVIPWTAGGYGDLKLEGGDRRPGWECQDGGINPDGKDGYELEKPKPRTEKEQEEFSKDKKEEKEAVEERERLEGPHQEEPNPGKCFNTYASCDDGLADLIINQLSLEQQNIVTDPLLNAWQDSSGYENTDECRFLFGPVRGGTVTVDPDIHAGSYYDQAIEGGNYYLNDAFNLAGGRLPYPGGSCLNNVNFEPRFTAPNTVNAGEFVGFDGMESDIDLNAGINYSATGVPQATYATYKWNFGDGTPEVSGYAPGAPLCETPWLKPCAASVLHSYQYGGTYTVTLTVTDVGGDVRSVQHEVTVVGPPPPSSGGTGSGSAGSAGSSSSGSSTGSGSGAGGKSLAVPPNPVAADAVISRTLRSVTKRGVVVRYSVNEQVAGHFEVMLSRSLAKRLGISGPAAVGLPAGSAPEIVIGKAILVTTAGGRNTAVIVLSKRTNQRLSHLSRVSLMLRLQVRNAAARTPASTTVLSAFTLTR